MGRGAERHTATWCNPMINKQLGQPAPPITKPLGRAPTDVIADYKAAARYRVVGITPTAHRLHTPRSPGFSKSGQGPLRLAQNPAIVPRGRRGWGGSQGAPAGVRGPGRCSIEFGGSDWLRWDHKTPASCIVIRQEAAASRDIISSRVGKLAQVNGKCVERWCKYMYKRSYTLLDSVVVDLRSSGISQGGGGQDKIQLEPPGSFRGPGQKKADFML